MDEKEAETRPVMGTILVYYICCRYVCRMSNHVESRESNTRMLKYVLGGKIRPVTPIVFVWSIR